MPKSTFTIYCTAPALDGKGGRYLIGDKIELDSKAEAHKLLSTNRFSFEKSDADKAEKKAVPKKEAAKK